MGRRSAIVLVLVTGCGGSDGPLPDVDAVLTVPDCATGRVLTPGQSTTLEVVARDPNGDPVSGVQVSFMAPDDSGITFAAPHAFGAGYTQSVTDDQGVASAELTVAEASGAWLVAAVAENAATEASFAVTVVDALPQLGVSAAEARCQIETELGLGALGPGALLHGPVYLAADTSIGSLDPGAEAELLAEGSWFFWLDEVRNAAFAHPTQFVVLGADASDAAVITSREWWPQITAAGEEYPRSLRPAYTANSAFWPAMAASRRAPPLPGGGAVPCAVALFGRTESTFPNSARAFYTFARDRAGARTYGEQFLDRRPPRVTVEEFADQLDQMLGDGCTKIYVGVFSHGMAGGIGPIFDGLAPGTVFATEKTRTLAYADLSLMLWQRFRGLEMCMIIDACQAGSSGLSMQGRGLRGELAMAARDGLFTYMEEVTLTDWTPEMYFSKALLECWGDPAVSPGPGLGTLKQAYDWVKARGEPIPNAGEPGFIDVMEDPTPLAVPDIAIVAPATDGEADLTVPGGPFPLGSVLESTVANPAVAVGKRRMLTPQMGARASLHCTGAGSSPFTVDVFRSDTGARYLGTGTVTVDNCPGFRVYPIEATYDAAAHRTNYLFSLEPEIARSFTLNWSGPDCGNYAPTAPVVVPSWPVETLFPSVLSWDHTHPPCELPDHSNITISAVVNSSQGGFRCTYQGTETGVGPVCTLLPGPVLPPGTNQQQR